MATIYRTYRPKTFADLTDQEHIVTTLQNEIKLGTLAHAYLFSGPRGVGKTTTARLLAKAVNCTARAKDSGEPCNECGACQQINDGRHIDVIEVDAASQTGVDNVRDNIIANAEFRPTSATYKVFIIDEVHMLSTGAFNALLKTLEEPPAYVIFILATTELHKLPATVISRCQRFHFKKISYDEMMKRLTMIAKAEDVEVAEEVLAKIIAKSDGCLRDAESLLGQVFSLHLKKITAKDTELMLPTSDSDSLATFIEHIFKNETTAALELLHKQIDEGASTDQFALGLLEMLRAILVIQATNQTKLYQADFSDQALQKLQSLAGVITAPQLIAIIETALKRRLEIKTAPVPQLPLEMFAVESALIVAGIAPAKPLIPAPTTTPTIEKKTPIIETPATAPAPATPASPRAPSTITLEAVQKQWNKIVDEIDVSNRSLTFILKMCRLDSCTNGYLTVAVPYSFHKEKLEEIKSRKIIDTILEKNLGEKIFISCIIDAPPAPAPDTETIELAMAFGGQVLE